MSSLLKMEKPLKLQTAMFNPVHIDTATQEYMQTTAFIYQHKISILRTLHLHRLWPQPFLSQPTPYKSALQSLQTHLW